MKSDDYPGKPKALGMRGMRRPVADIEIHKDESESASRAQMLEQARQRVVTPEQSPSIAVQEGEPLGTNTELKEVQVSTVIRSPYQPRLVFNEQAIEELANSIQSVGLGKPILVRPLPDGSLELVGGERRWRAIQLLGKTTILALIRPMTDAMAMLLALTDNTQEDLTDYELGVSYDRILKAGEESSQRALSRRLGIDVSIVSRRLTLMQLPDNVRKVLDVAPHLITTNYAKRFVELAAVDKNIVERVVVKMLQTGAGQEAAIRMIDKEIADKTTVHRTTVNNSRAVGGFGSLKVSGRKLEFKCEKGIDVALLSERFEQFLKTIDLKELAEKA